MPTQLYCLASNEFNQLKCFVSGLGLAWLSCVDLMLFIKFKSLMRAYRVFDGSAPLAQGCITYVSKIQLLLSNVTPRTLRSSSDRRLALPSVQARQSRLFSFVVPRWWNELPSTTRAGASLSTFKKLLKTQLFREHLPS